jgi:undecaprenyl-diphosphatase
VEILNALDTALLLFLNKMHNPFLDFLMYWASSRWVWIPFYIYIFLELFKKYPKHVWEIIVFVTIMIALSDQLTSTIIKNAVHRLRPCHEPMIRDEIHLVNGYCGGSFGFVSSHAANSFAFLSFFIFLFRTKHKKLRWIIIGWAVLISYSRIYLGVHYPGDVFCGALLGSLLGISTGYSYNFYRENFHKSEKSDAIRSGKRYRRGHRSKKHHQQNSENEF